MSVPGSGWVRAAVGAPVLLPARVFGLLDEVGDLLADLRGSAARVRALLDELERIPATVDALLGQVDAVLTEVRPLPSQVDAVLAAVRPIPGQVQQVLHDAGGVVADARVLPQRVTAVLDDVEVAVTGVQPTLAVLQQAQALLTAMSALDPALADDVTRLLRTLPPIMERVDEQVLPAVAALEGLVPVVAKLSVTVDNLDHQVVEVGSLLGGIPGAGRLLKRGERDARQRALHLDGPA